MSFSVLSRVHACRALAAGALLLAAVGLMTGCGGSNPYPVGSYDRAMYYLEDGKNLQAAQALESFVRNNPTDERADEAQYQKALLFITTKEYPLAAVEFQILRKDFPTSERVEDAYFQEGVAYFLQVGKVQRDVTGAHEARLHFLKFSREYPDSKHLPAVRDYMAQISDLMVKKRLQQAKVFWQLKRYAAIEVTLKTAMENEAGSSLLDEVMWRRAEAALKQDDQALAQSMYTRLLTDFPDSRFAGRARKAKASLENLDGPESSE